MGKRRRHKDAQAYERAVQLLQSLKKGERLPKDEKKKPEK